MWRGLRESRDKKVFTCPIRTLKVLTEFDLEIKAYGLDPDRDLAKMDLCK
jgi:hypothetical protein